MFATDVFTAETITEITAITDTITGTEPVHVADAAFDKDIRIIVLYIEVILGTVGGAGVFLWLWFNRRRKSRVNKLIMHVAISDLSVIFCACLPQLIWEYDRRWKAGDAGCRIVKFMQSFSMMASNNMLVVLSLDRLQAICWPLKTPIAVSKYLCLPKYHLITKKEAPHHASSLTLVCFGKSHFKISGNVWIWTSSSDMELNYPFCLHGVSIYFICDLASSSDPFAQILPLALHKSRLYVQFLRYCFFVKSCDIYNFIYIRTSLMPSGNHISFEALCVGLFCMVSSLLASSLTRTR